MPISVPSAVAFDIREPIVGDSFSWDGIESPAAKNTFVIHATASTAPNEDGFSMAEYHVNHNGWGGIGVHFVVTKDSYAGRPDQGLPAGVQAQYVGDLLTMRAGVANNNQGKIHMEISGLFTPGNGVPGEAQLRKARAVIEQVLFHTPELPNLNSWGQVTYHNAVAIQPAGATACPGWEHPQFNEWFNYLKGGAEPSWFAKPQPTAAPAPAPEPPVFWRLKDKAGIQLAAYSNEPNAVAGWHERGDNQDIRITSPDGIDVTPAPAPSSAGGQDDSSATTPTPEPASVPASEPMVVGNPEPQSASAAGSLEITPKSGTATLGKAAKIYDLLTLEPVGIVAASDLNPKMLAIKGSVDINGIYYLMTQNMVDAAAQGTYHGIRVSDFLPKQDAAAIQMESGMFNKIKQFLSGLWPFKR